MPISILIIIEIGRCLQSEGDKINALCNYQKSLALNPGNEKIIIKEIKLTDQVVKLKT